MNLMTTSNPLAVLGRLARAAAIPITTPQPPHATPTCTQRYQHAKHTRTGTPNLSLEKSKRERETEREGERDTQRERERERESFVVVLAE